MTITAPAPSGPDWAIRAVDIAVPSRPWEDPTVPGTHFTADSREEAEALLPRIRATVVAYIEDTPGTALDLIRIVAIEYHGTAIVGLVSYSSNGDIPDDETALRRRLVADDPAAETAADTARRTATAARIAEQPGTTATENETRQVLHVLPTCPSTAPDDRDLINLPVAA